LRVAQPKLLWVLVAGSVGITAPAAPELVLADFRAAQVSTLALTDAKVQKLPAGLQVATGHQASWPGISLRAPGESWNLAAFAQIIVDVKNGGTHDLTLFCRVDNAGADGVKNCLTGSVKLNSGQKGSIRIPLKRAHDDTLEGKLFGMRGYPVSAGGPGTIDPAHVTQLLVFVSKPTADHVFEIREVRATGTYTPPTAWVTDASPFFPFIDTFGQYRHKDWPGKVKSLADLRARQEDETRQLQAQPGPRGWDKYGGAATGPQLKATGFFRTEKVGPKWWLVDPDGHLFFSHGIDCVRAFDSTPIEERETWFADFPGRQAAFASFLSHDFALKGHFAGRSPECFSFVGANLLRKYGPDWSSIYPKRVQERLRSWGLNTIANWSDPATRRLRQTPYTDSIGSGRTPAIESSEGYWGKFPDVFAPQFADNLRRGMESKHGDSAGDPWCIGYFSDNEMAWGDENSLAIAALQSPASQPAKLAFLNDLKTKYGEVSRLNQAWGSAFSSWDAFLANRTAPDKTKAAPDLGAFYSRTAEQYFRSVRAAIKAAAPNQLYLGCRFAWVNSRAAAAAAKYCDVVSYNLYRANVADFKFNGGVDVPLLIGEFHFGALDRGLFHTGLVSLPNQQARAETYKSYVQGAVKHPQFVGCHWFQYFDEPTIGRTYDEENYQIGFVDIADTPYQETIEASREVGYHLYPEAK
jgi:hypothetical protein